MEKKEESKNRGDLWFKVEHEVSWDPFAGNYLDYSDKKALMDQIIIDFNRDGTDRSIAFKAFITDYSEAYEEIKSDAPVDISKISALELGNLNSVRRSITLSWKTVAASFEEAKDNMKRCSELIQMVYPLKDGSIAGKSSSHGGRSAESGISENYDLGLFNVRFAQWLVNSKLADSDDPGKFARAKTTGLSCRIPSLTYSPDFEEGSFDGPNGFFPKVINLSCTILAQDVDNDGRPEALGKYPHGYKGYEAPELELALPKLSESEDNHDEYEQAIEWELTQ